MEEDEVPPERKGRKGAGKRSDPSGAGSVAKPKAKPKGSADVERNLLLD